MVSNSAKQIQEYDLSSLSISEWDIEKRDLDPIHLFEIRVQDHTYGPIFRDDLKNYLAQTPTFPITALLKTFGTLDEWTPLFDHPYFERRKLAVVTDTPERESQTEYFLFIRGQKDGPFTLEDLNKKIAAFEVLLTDSVSVDYGKTWTPLYNIKELNRRKQRGKILPVCPLDIVNNDTPSMNKDEFNAIGGLAYLGYLKSGKNIEQKIMVDAPRVITSDTVIAPDPVFEPVMEDHRAFPIMKIATGISLLLSAIILFQVYQYAVKRQNHIPTIDNSSIETGPEKSGITSQSAPTNTATETGNVYARGETITRSPANNRIHAEIAPVAPRRSQRTLTLTPRSNKPKPVVSKSKRLGLSSLDGTSEVNPFFNMQHSDESVDNLGDRISPRTVDPTYGEDQGEDRIQDDATTSQQLEAEIFNAESSN